MTFEILFTHNIRYENFLGTATNRCNNKNGWIACFVIILIPEIYDVALGAAMLQLQHSSRWTAINIVETRRYVHSANLQGSPRHVRYLTSLEDTENLSTFQDAAFIIGRSRHHVIHCRGRVINARPEKLTVLKLIHFWKLRNYSYYDTRAFYYGYLRHATFWKANMISFVKM